MKNWIWLTVLMQLTILSNVALADTLEDKTAAENVKIRPESLRDVPDGIILLPKDKRGYQSIFKPQEEYKCFNMKDWGEVGHLITDYHWLWKYSLDLELELRIQQNEVKNLNRLIIVGQDNFKAVDRGYKFMNGLFDEDHKLNLELQRSSRFELWITRSVAVVGFVAATVFVTMYGTVK